MQAIENNSGADSIEGAVQSRQALEKLNQELRDSEERYRTLFDLCPVAVYSIDTSGVIRNFNSRAAEMWGRKPALGDTDERFCGSYRLYRPYGTFMPHAECPMAEVVTGKVSEVRDAEVHIERPDGSRIAVIVNIRSLKNDRDEIVGAINCFYDITGRQRAEEERERLLVREREANRSKDQLIAVVSHELRTPLTPILMWTRMLKSDSSPAEISRAMEVIERNVRLQLRLIEDLLNLNHVVTGKALLELAEHDLDEIVGSQVDIIRSDAREKGVRLEIFGAGHPLRVHADVGRLQQVFANILSNSLKFTPSGGSIQVSLGCEAGSAVVKIQDSGAGIVPEFLPHVFEMFRQQENGMSRSHSGLGIGLALVKGLVDMHGGNVAVKSEGRGTGAEVTVRLPLLTSPEERRVPETMCAQASLSPDLEGFSILLVEDSNDSRGATEFMLDRLGAKVTAVSGASEALTAIAAANPDLILCDLAMPQMDGFWFIEELQRARSACPPVIAVSGLAAEADHQRTRAAGFAGHINKPFDEISLMTAIKSAQAGRSQ